MTCRLQGLMLLVLLVLEMRCLMWHVRAWWAAVGRCLAAVAHPGHSVLWSLHVRHQAIRSWLRW